jgi:hypothetical protein
MLSSAPALLLPPPSEPLVLLAARTIAANLASGEPITRRQLHTLLTDHFGGTDADGRWSVRDAYIALELAQTEFLQATPQIDLAASAADADRMFTSLESVLPTQTNRSDEQIEWQQFATPPRLAWLAARACAWPQTSSCWNPRPEQGCSRSGRPRLARALPQRNLAASPRLPERLVPGCPSDRP